MPRRFLIRLALPALLALSLAPPHMGPARAQFAPAGARPPAPARDSIDEEAAVRASVARLANAIQNRDVNVLRLLHIEDESISDVKSLSASLQVGRVGFSGDGDKALARYALTVWGVRGRQSTPLKRGLQDLILTRVNGSWNVVRAAWEVPDPTLDALQELCATTSLQWDALHSDAPEASADIQGAVVPSTGPGASEVLHMVAERRGGRWIALRYYAWDGRVLSPQALARREAQARTAAPAENPANGAQRNAQSGSVQWLGAQLGRWAREGDGKGGGTLHLLLQNGARDWVGLDGVWEPRLSEAPQAASTSPRATSRNAPNTRDESLPSPRSDEDAAQAASLRAEISDDAVVLGSDAAHKKLAQVLEGAGLFAEAADEWEKAALLVPAMAAPGRAVSAARLEGAQARRAWDPRARAATQIHNETQVGIDALGPRKLLPELLREQRITATPLRALSIGLEYSKLGADALASSWLARARDMLARGWRLAPEDAAWADVIDEHLEQRAQLTRIKPQNLIASGLFTVRCRLDDLSVLPLLAALEAAQHTVYADFSIPMGSTEVVLWPDQPAFQSYTTRFSSQGASEFVAALTLTKLIATQSGPWVLGEDINVFVDPRLADATFGTVAHEYGHVAVRQMSKGRTVPVWFNEGLATTVEGGYDGAIERVRGAKRARRLLSMDEMARWNVDGERAFLAYSQANSMVDFIIATWGSDRLLEILRQIARDVPPEQAFATALGIGTDQLWSRWAREGIR